MEMNRLTLVTSIAGLALAAAAPGCSSIKGLFSGEKNGPGTVNDLVSAIEKVYVNSELSKERVRVALDALGAIAASEYKGDALLAYTKLDEAITDSEEHAEALRASVEDMQDAAEPVFERWFEDLKQISSPEMRQRSRARLLATRERYDAIVAAVEPAMASYEAVNKNLRDHALFLGHDLNPASVADIREDVRTLGTQADALDASLDVCLKAARDYVDSAALPTVSAEDETAEPRIVPVSGPGPREPGK
jgi:hypothetical protein